MHGRKQGWHECSVLLQLDYAGGKVMTWRSAQRRNRKYFFNYLVLDIAACNICMILQAACMHSVEF
jgi:hypothetical protein